MLFMMVLGMVLAGTMYFVLDLVQDIMLEREHEFACEVDWLTLDMELENTWEGKSCLWANSPTMSVPEVFCYHTEVVAEILIALVLLPTRWAEENLVLKETSKSTV